ILILAVLVWTFGKAGSWVLACGFMRYGFVAAGTVMPWMARPLAATVRGKTVAVLQLAGLGAALAPPVTPPASTAAAAIALASLTWSFAVDIGRLWRARDGRRTA
ncbi:MAG: CDP-alcohol phosphatidyltransferase family protein, partial [Acidobacteria bacterium]|nr:CDP-alcohol phosphatidyltransferase family protein [Acidobacteriota bacterium]